MTLSLKLSISQLERRHTHLLVKLALHALAATMLMSCRLWYLILLWVIVHAALNQVQLLTVGKWRWFQSAAHCFVVAGRRLIAWHGCCSAIAACLGERTTWLLGIIWFSDRFVDKFLVQVWNWVWADYEKLARLRYQYLTLFTLQDSNKNSV